MRKKSVIDRLEFGRCEDEFELLETERGGPGFFGGWRETPPQQEKKQKKKVSASLAENEERLRHEMRADVNPDVIFRRFVLGGKTDALAVYMNGLADASHVSDFILREGMRPGSLDQVEKPLIQHLTEKVFTLAEAKTEEEWDKAKSAISQGCTTVFVEGESQAIVMDTRSFEHRGVAAPQNEKVVRGSQEGFVENLRTNITLLRRLIHTDDLVVEIRPSGGDSGARLAVIYRDGVANITLINEVKRRLAKVNTRAALNAGMLEQLTERHGLSPLPQVLGTERPDRAASMIMEGHVVVVMDGSPIVNVAPATLFTLMATSEDTFLRRPQGSIIRVVRFIGAFISILLPGYFLALALHHQGLLSTEVLTTVIASRKMVFEPIGTEMLFLLVVFQLIREAGMRVPGNIGQAIGIIGGLILGQAAVSANLASSVVLIIVALTGLGNFCIPDYSAQLAASLFRVIVLVAAWMAGLLGICCGVLIIVGWMASLKSYGVPFLAPYAPKTYSKRPMILRGRLNNHQKAEDTMNTEEEGGQ